MRRLEDNRDRIISAAIRCFERDGVRQTNLSEVAVEAGLSRKTVYRTFKDRAALLLTIVERRIRHINGLVNDRLQECDSLRTALVDGIALTVRVTKADTLFNAVVAEATDRSVEILIIDANDDIRELFAGSWRPLIERARRSGELSSPLPNERLIEGIRNFVALLVIRSGDDDNERRLFLEDFLVPAILGGAALEAKTAPLDKSRQIASVNVV